MELCGNASSKKRTGFCECCLLRPQLLLPSYGRPLFSATVCWEFKGQSTVLCFCSWVNSLPHNVSPPDSQVLHRKWLFSLLFNVRNSFIQGLCFTQRWCPLGVSPWKRCWMLITIPLSVGLVGCSLSHGPNSAQSLWFPWHWLQGACPTPNPQQILSPMPSYGCVSHWSKSYLGMEFLFGLQSLLWQLAASRTFGQLSVAFLVPCWD